MATAPKYKVYDNEGEYVASCKHSEDAAIIVLIGYGDRGTIRYGHSKTLYTAGIGDGSLPSAPSYDEVARLVEGREMQMQEIAFAKIHGRAK